MYLPFAVNDASHAATTDEVCLATTVSARLRPECVWEVSSKTETHYLVCEYLGALKSVEGTQVGKVGRYLR